MSKVGRPGGTGATEREPERWAKGDAYERYLGRWSTRLANLFVNWLDLSPGMVWLDVGCGSGALTRAILSAHRSHALVVLAVDQSAGFVEAARSLVSDHRAGFSVASATDLPFAVGTFDVVVSGLVLNFLDDPVAGLHEMARVSRPGATVGAYVWDYTGEMWLLRHFWEAAFELVPEARQLDEVRRFAACRPAPLQKLFTTAGLEDVEVAALDASAEFKDFDDYWAPFLAGQGAAPSFAVSLEEPTRIALAASLRQRLPTAWDGSIRLGLRAWVVRGRVAVK